MPAPVNTSTPICVADGIPTSLIAQMSPCAASKPAVTIRRRTSTPASYHVLPGFACTQVAQAASRISGMAWNCGPFAWI